MKQQATALIFRRPSEVDSMVADGFVRPRSSARTWVDNPLLIVCFCLLSLSVFSSLTSLSHLVLLLAVSGGVLYVSYLNGSSLERTHERQVALFLVVLVNVYLISLTKGGSGRCFFGLTVIEAASLMGITAFALWLIRMARLKTFTIIRSSVDVAMLLLLLLTSLFFIILYVLIDLNGLTMRLEFDLLWVVLVTSLLSYVLRDLLGSQSSIKRALRILLLPLVTVCLWFAISLWRMP
jgi:hypothetical protein